MRYKAIIFDFFGVISSEVGIRWLKGKFGQEKGKEIEAKYGPLADKEEITEEELFRQMAQLANESPEEVKGAWERLVNINQQVVEIIKSLKPNYKIILLSNTTRPFFSGILGKNKIEELFDDMVLSYEVKAVKPEPDIYQIALGRSGLEPFETIFIDDREENVLAAEALGIKGILFKDAQKLKTDLKNLGVL
jgi:epoxide hydrolase-like predicted phosphatase